MGTIKIQENWPGQVWNSGSAIGTWRGNEPAGYTELTSDDHDNNDDVDGWDYWNQSSEYQLVNVGDEPGVDGHGQDGVYRAIYPAGTSDGQGDKSNAGDSSGGWGDMVEMYWAYTIKLSANWKNNPNLVKHALWFWGDHIGGWLGLKTDGSDPEGDIHVMIRMKEPNTGHHTFNPSPKSLGYITRDEWHQIEFQVIGNTSNANKSFRIWVNGEMVLEELDYSGATEEGPHQGDFINSIKYANTYGGGGGGYTVPEEQHIDVGHSYMSRVVA